MSLWEKSHSRIYLILEFAPRGEMYKSLQKQPKQRSVQSQYIFVNSEHPSQSNVIFGSQAQAMVKSCDYKALPAQYFFWVWAIENCYGTENISFFWSMAKVLHVHNDLGLFNNTTISFIFVLSPLRLFQTLATSLRGPITPVKEMHLILGTWTQNVKSPFTPSIRPPSRRMRVQGGSR